MFIVGTKDFSQYHFNLPWLSHPFQRINKTKTSLCSFSLPMCILILVKMSFQHAISSPVSGVHTDSPLSAMTAIRKCWLMTRALTVTQTSPLPTVWLPHLEHHQCCLALTYLYPLSDASLLPHTPKHFPPVPHIHQLPFLPVSYSMRFPGWSS